MSFVDQGLSNDVFISTVRPSERRARHTTNQTDGSGCRSKGTVSTTDHTITTENHPLSACTVSLVSHVPLTCKTFGVDCSSCRAATMITLTYSCPSCSKLYPHLGRLLVACRSLPVLTVIVSPLWGRFACFVVISSRFRRYRVCENGASISWEGRGA